MLHNDCYNPDVSYALARDAALRVLTDSRIKDAVFPVGGLVPWMASGGNSPRLHGDVDFSVPIDAMPIVRRWLMESGLYAAALDSRNLRCNAARADYGVHALIDGVIVSFCPFYFEGRTLHQRNASLLCADGFEALFAADIEGIDEKDYIEKRVLPDGGKIGSSTLEACRAAKVCSGRPKDQIDIAEIDRLGYDEQRFERLRPAFEAMTITCVAHEN